MRKLEIENPEEMREAIMDEITRSEEAKYDLGYTGYCSFVRDLVVMK